MQLRTSSWDQLSLSILQTEREHSSRGTTRLDTNIGLRLIDHLYRVAHFDFSSAFQQIAGGRKTSEVVNGEVEGNSSLTEIATSTWSGESSTLRVQKTFTGCLGAGSSDGFTVLLPGTRLLLSFPRSKQ